jgi:hypothetical protein
MPSRSEEPVKEAPHCLQNLAFAALDVPQLGQTRSRGCPQFWQKRASDGFSYEQLWHFIMLTRECRAPLYISE